jgi:hypothetical protein
VRVGRVERKQRVKRSGNKKVHKRVGYQSGEGEEKTSRNISLLNRSASQDSTAVMRIHAEASHFSGREIVI